MSALRSKDLRALLDDLVRQGARLRQTRNGVRVLFPNGTSTTLHRTDSDHRAALNIRSRVLRAGLTWPTDPQQKRERMPSLSTDQQAALDLSLVAAGEGPCTVTSVADRAGVSHGAAKRAMGLIGFVQGQRGHWVRPHPAPAALPYPNAVDGTYPEIDRARVNRLVTPADWSAPLAAPAPAPAVPTGPIVRSRPVGTPVPVAAEEREFIDSVNSWTIEVPRKLQAMATEMGLHIEVRVWH